jgi:hypothetical protein
MPLPRRNPSFGGPVPGAVRTDTQSPTVDRARLAEIKDALVTKSVVESMDILHRGPFETFYLSDQRIPTPAQWNNVPFAVLSFLVSSGYTLAVDALSMSFSESVLPQSTAVGWRIAINGIRVPNVTRALILGLEWSLGTLGNPHHAISINPIWVQSNQTVTLEVTDLTGTMTEFVSIVAVLSGKLYPNVGGSV